MMKWRRATVALRSLMVILAALWQPAAALAQDFALGLAASQQGDYLLAARIWYPLAEAGDPHSQFGLGTLFHEGLGVEADLTESAYWFHRAAEQGLAEAQYNLGNAYKHGEGVGQSDRMAVHWWQRAAEQGFGPAQYNLATAYRYARGLPADPGRARYWYHLAAEQGHPMASQALEALAEDSAPAASSDITPQATGNRACSPWLAIQPDDHYSVQFMASRERKDAEAYAARLSLEGSILVCRYPRDDETWYAVLWGSHPGLAAARRAVADLPPALREGEPWIRSIASLRRAGATTP